MKVNFDKGVESENGIELFWSLLVVYEQETLSRMAGVSNKQTFLSTKGGGG